MTFLLPHEEGPDRRVPLFIRLRARPNGSPVSVTHRRRERMFHVERNQPDLLATALRMFGDRVELAERYHHS